MQIQSLLLSLFLMLAAVVGSPGADQFPWMENLEEARAVASASGAPMLIVFRCEP